jgi:hypothetical protein
LRKIDNYRRGRKRNRDTDGDIRIERRREIKNHRIVEKHTKRKGQKEKGREREREREIERD